MHWKSHVLFSFVIRNILIWVLDIMLHHLRRLLICLPWINHIWLELCRTAKDNPPVTFAIAACETQNVNVTVLPCFGISGENSVTASDMWNTMVQVTDFNNLCWFVFTLSSRNLYVLTLLQIFLKYNLLWSPWFVFLWYLSWFFVILQGWTIWSCKF